MNAAAEFAKLEARRMAAIEAGDVATFEALGAEATKLAERMSREAPRSASPRLAPRRSAATAAASWRRR